MTEEKYGTISTLLLTIAIICMIIGLSPQSRGYTDPETHEKIVEWSLGLDSSPLWEYREEQSVGGSFRFKWTFRYFSWSSVLLVIGVLSFKKWFQRQKKHKKAAG